MGWEIAPDGLRDTLIGLHREYAPREIVVTENGAAYPGRRRRRMARSTTRPASVPRRATSPRSPTRATPACR